MHPHIILSILRKDLLDATRDARVLIALLMPIAIALFYNFIFDDEPPAVDATVAYTAGSPTQLPQRLEAISGDTIDLTFNVYADGDQVRAQLAADDADIGLVLQPGFDEAVARGESPPLEVILPDDPGLDSEYVLSALTPVLWEMAGRGPPATIEVVTSELDAGNESVIEQLGPRSYIVLTAMLTFVVFVAMLAMPVTLTEEVEKKTLDALALIASHGDIIAAKALLGILYVIVGIPLLLVLTSQIPEEPLVFAGAVMLLSVTLMGFGLFVGALFRNANQLNTWAGIYLLPVIAPAFMIGLPLPDEIQSALLFLPTSHAMRILVNTMNGEQLFSNAVVSWLVLALWGAVGYSLLAWRISQQRA